MDRSAKTKTHNMGKERGVKKVHALLTVVKLHVMAVHFVCVVAQGQTHPK